MLFPISDDDRLLIRPAWVTHSLLVANVLLFSGNGTLGQTGSTGGVAYAAHIGGFVAGVGAGLIVRLLPKEEPTSVFARIYDDSPKVRRGLL